MLPQSMRIADCYVYTMSRCPDVCPLPTSAFLLRTNTEPILIKFGGEMTSFFRHHVSIVSNNSIENCLIVLLLTFY